MKGLRRNAKDGAEYARGLRSKFHHLQIQESCKLPFSDTVEVEFARMFLKEKSSIQQNHLKINTICLPVHQECARNGIIMRSTVKNVP